MALSRRFFISAPSGADNNFSSSFDDIKLSSRSETFASSIRSGEKESIPRLRRNLRKARSAIR
ncbi:hypothetical protein COT82_00205 [Candidatus Campbellbacteria bacterium CG10_big_fil_rev_8_21_14_0_10_35_52]|uniref:Uncharacterized protein n=1 Tax=Candidatus Campbellbacteria bacterium CG10_big_fil_rev_8_21_14_0_10_35_52 TaxID=1974527 RepID=A0A2M6WWA5_9BACT|nr:MAG: hypothetical protein COT82_00205 [Candidatus Campbellbacteria bacterium CG10_big_fil_rev_8_21_14_0_10_35_52]